MTDRAAASRRRFLGFVAASPLIGASSWAQRHVNAAADTVGDVLNEQ